MALPTVELKYLGTVHSPFSGLAADSDDGANVTDPSLLFIYYGNAGIWDYVSPRLADQLPNDADELDPIELAEILELPGGLVMVVDTDWNGINYYGFGPAGPEELPPN